MFNKFDFKYIIKRVIIGLAIGFILFNVNKCNAYALTFKTQQDIATTNSYGTGTLTTGTNWVGTMTFNQHFIPSNYDYDYIGIRLTRFNFVKSTDFDLDNPALNGTPTSFSWYCSYAGSTTCTNASISSTNTSSIPNSLYGNIIAGDITISANMYTESSGVPCWFDNSLGDNIILCPIDKNHDYYSHLQLVVTYNGFDSVKYYIEYSLTKLFYNNDSTEIVNGLSGVQQQQQQTNDIITDPSTSQSTTSGQNFITNGQSAISSKFEQATSYNQFMGILNNFLGQMSNATCQPINLPIPYTEETLVLPCLGNEFTQRIPALWTLYKLIITGALGIVLWKYFIGFIKAIMDPYNIGATNLPIGGGK